MFFFLFLLKSTRRNILDQTLDVKVGQDGISNLAAINLIYVNNHVIHIVGSINKHIETPPWSLWVYTKTMQSINVYFFFCLGLPLLVVTSNKATYYYIL